MMDDRCWIRTEERLPDKRDWYLGIFQEADTGWINPVPFICDYLLGKHTAYTTKEGWILKECTDNDNPLDYYFNLKCLAWRPLPEPPEWTELVELKPCPFCGRKAKLVKGTDYSEEVEKPTWMVVCTNKDCIIYDGYGRYVNDKEKAKEMWNIRGI